MANVATRLFGVTVKPEAVIGETLRRATPARDPADAQFQAELREALEGGRPQLPGDYELFRAHPLASWIETTFGLQTGSIAKKMVARHAAVELFRDRHGLSEPSACRLSGYNRSPERVRGGRSTTADSVGSPLPLHAARRKANSCQRLSNLSLCVVSTCGARQRFNPLRARRQIRHLYIRLYTPPTNGKPEPFLRTLKDHWPRCLLPHLSRPNSRAGTLAQQLRSPSSPMLASECSLRSPDSPRSP